MKTFKTGPLFRSEAITREAVNQEARTVELSFSSEEPIERWFGHEILDHTPSAVRMDRLRTGAPLLLDHVTREQVGVVEAASIRERRGTAVVRFSKSARGEEVFQDVLDGIRRNVSVGYRIHEVVLEKETEGVATYRATDWEPLEVSLVAVPADPTVGVGRQHATEYAVRVIDPQGGSSMEKEPKETPPAIAVVSADAGRDAERKRVSEILAIGEKYQCEELARKAVSGGSSIEEFRAVVLEKVFKAEPIPVVDPMIGLNEKEVRQFSFVRAIHSLASGQGLRNAPFEQEVSDAVAKKMKKETRGFLVPADVMQAGIKTDTRSQSERLLQALASLFMQRDLTKGSFSGGGALVSTDLLAASFIELLRNRMMVIQMGARTLGGLVGDVAIPRQTGGATAYWVAESGAPTESQPSVGQLGLTPKTCGAYTDISRKLSMQASLDVESFVRTDLAAVLALAKDLAAINGSGSAGQPLGILGTTGIGDVAGGTNGLAPTWAHIVTLETEVAQDNADVGSLGYLTNAKVRGKLKQTQRFSSTDSPIWGMGPNLNGVGEMNGYRSGVSNQVPSTLTKGSSSGVCSAIIFGNWADMIIAEWGSLDVLVDPYTGGAAGTTRVRVLQDTDIALRHVESFAAMQDALTT